MNYNDVYGGDFLKAESMPGHPVQLHIRDIEVTSFEDRQTKESRKQIVLHFHRTDKRLGLNKTNADRIAHMYGPETQNWIDKPIQLHLENVQAFGEIKPAIRVVLPPPAQQTAAPGTYQAPEYVAPPAGYTNAPPQQAPGPADGGDPFAEVSRPPPQASNGAPPPSSLPDDDFDDDIPF